VFAFLLSLVAVWLNDVAAGWGREGVERVVLESVEPVVYSKLAMEKSYTSKSFSINVRGIDGRRLIEPVITYDDSPPFTITCKWAELKADLAKSMLTLRCFDGEISVGGAGGVTYSFPKKYFERSVPLGGSSDHGGRASPQAVPLNRIAREVELQQQQNTAIGEQLALDAANQMIDGQFVRLTDRHWAGEITTLGNEQERLYRLLIEPARRWANGFSCLFFVLIGAPMAIRMRNSDFLTSFFACFCPILIVYYPLLILGVDQAKRGTFPAWSVWIGNAILAMAGAWLMRKVVRY
jgi:lipopolysaccharide export system permease protein